MEQGGQACLVGYVHDPSVWNGFGSKNAIAKAHLLLSWSDELLVPEQLRWRGDNNIRQNGELLQEDYQVIKPFRYLEDIQLSMQGDCLLNRKNKMMGMGKETWPVAIEHVWSN